MSRNAMQGDDPIQLIFSIAVLIFSIIAHEVSHGYMAQYLGDSTARFAGRLTMNPIKHIDPVGSLLVPFAMVLSGTGFVFGWAKPVPYNPYNLRDQKWGDAKVAFAGPLSNFGIAVVFALLVRVASPDLSAPMVELMLTIVYMNVGLGIFNLFPLPPLDGSKILMNILPLRYRYIFSYLERYSFFFILFIVFFLMSPIAALVGWVFRFLVG